MRLHRTYVLRLLIDTDTSSPEPVLRGSLQAIEDQQTHPFKSGQALLALLQRLSDEKAKKETSPQENKP
jgi:hypothetical protein